MGACDVQWQLKGQANEFRVKQSFERQLEYDRAENGHQQGYSGDTQTLDGVKCHFYKGIFKSYEEARAYCEANAEKGCYAIAVHYLTSIKDGRVIDTLVWGLGAC